MSWVIEILAFTGIFQRYGGFFVRALRSAGIGSGSAAVNMDDGGDAGLFAFFDNLNELVRG